MYLRTLAATLSLCSVLASATPIAERQSGCSFNQKVAGIQWEIDTISSHSFDTANNIPLSDDATRTFLVTPNGLDGLTLPPINVGLSAETVRAELVGLATVLDAAVPAHSVHYIHNAHNGSVTVDFIQLDQIVLPSVHVREIHTFNSDCQITSILGYVHGDLVCTKLGDLLQTSSLVKALCVPADNGGLLGVL